MIYTAIEDFTVGDWVRVVTTVEGRILRKHDAAIVDIRLANGRTTSVDASLDASAQTWERITQPEPLWHEGDVVRDASGRVYERSSSVANMWFAVGTSGLFPDDVPVRPLTHLASRASLKAREGEEEDE